MEERMNIRIGINGFGRIGRNYLRLALQRGHEVVAVNDVTDPATLAHLLKYDSAYGPLDDEVGHSTGAIVIDGRRIAVSAERDPADLGCAGEGVDLLAESTGRFRRREEAAAHLRGGAHKVVPDFPISPHQPDVFHNGATRHLPDPIRRWLCHAIKPNAPLLEHVRLSMHGQIRLGTWRRFTARQLLEPPNAFTWAATAHVVGLPVIGFDRYVDGIGEMRWRLLRVFPVMSGDGPDITRSAAGRLACETVMTPAVALALPWEPIDESHAVAHLTIGGYDHRVTVKVAPTGALRSVSMPRWGRPTHEEYGEYPFGASFHREATFGDYTIPSMARVGWWYGTERWNEGEFFRYTIDSAIYS
jgi:hypothetical protein